MTNEKTMTRYAAWLLDWRAWSVFTLWGEVTCHRLVVMAVDSHGNVYVHDLGGHDGE